MLLVLSFQKRMRVVFLVGIIVAVVLLSSPIIWGQLTGRFSLMAATDISDLWKEAQVNAYRGNTWWVGGIDNSLLLRIKTLVIGLDAFRRHPLCGMGLGSFVPYYEKMTGRPNVAAHNDYLLYLTETGIMGLTLYLVMQIKIIRKLLRRGTSEAYLFATGVAGAYISVNIFSFLSNSYYFYEIQLLIWMGIGISLSLLRGITK